MTITAKEFNILIPEATKIMKTILGFIKITEATDT